MKPITYLEGIATGLFEEMERDGSVFLMGEDIGAYGGAFKLTRGFIESFGPERVRDMPMSESAIIGAATGAALLGMRPVVEMQFADFVSCGFNQIVTVAAKTHYRWQTPVPIVIRCPSGGGVHGGMFHSQNPEAWFANVPGLKIVAPSTPTDAKGLIKSAIRDPNPVLFFEHKALYRQPAIREIDPGPDWLIRIGKANVRREGGDLTIVTYGAMVHAALRAAEILSSEEELEAEVVDLRSLIPWDVEAVIASVKKTSRVLVVHEATRTGGIGAEIAAVIAEEGFSDLDAPVRRLGAPDTPVPFSPPLEEYFIPGTDRIVAEARDLASF